MLANYELRRIFNCQLSLDDSRLSDMLRQESLIKYKAGNDVQQDEKPDDSMCFTSLNIFQAIEEGSAE